MRFVPMAVVAGGPQDGCNAPVVPPCHLDLDAHVLSAGKTREENTGAPPLVADRDRQLKALRASRASFLQRARHCGSRPRTTPEAPIWKRHRLITLLTARSPGLQGAEIPSSTLSWVRFSSSFPYGFIFLRILYKEKILLLKLVEQLEKLLRVAEIHRRFFVVVFDVCRARDKL